MKGRAIGASLAAALTVAGALVAKWEPAPGAAMYRAHQDPTGVWEICYGHTRGVMAGMTATQEQCEAWRDEDLLIANAAIDRCISHPLLPNQRGALISGVYNLGTQLVCGSTLQRKANAGDLRGACAELDRWINAAGKPMRGLVLRRAEERAACWPSFNSVRSGGASTARVAA